MGESIQSSEAIVKKLRSAFVSVALLSVSIASACLILHKYFVYRDLVSLSPVVSSEAWIVLGLVVVSGLTSALLARPLTRSIAEPLLKQIEDRDLELAAQREEFDGQLAARSRELREIAYSVSETSMQLDDEAQEREKAEKELGELHSQLAQSSRAARMAELATDVLHNVGNVLNSINISVQLLKDQSKQSKVVELARAVKMIPERDEDLLPYLSEDRKGRKLVPYISKVSTVLTAERERSLADILKLTEDVDHIKHIISMQQDYARSGNSLDWVSPMAVIRDAIRMNRVSLQRHDVEIDFHSDELPNMKLDRHKVIQILVNLIRNAKQAMDTIDPEKKKVTIDASYSEKGFVRIEVKDTGIGISPENMRNLFEHGFTTKEDGHGFGLHSSASSAKTMNGTLTVASEGVGRGATFTLEFPAELAEEPGS